MEKEAGIEVDDGILQEYDNEKLATFTNYIRTCLLPHYESLWNTFAMLEDAGRGPAVVAQRERMDLALADIEAEFILERRQWLLPGHPMQELFFATTYAGVALDVDNKT